ncbi:MAG TPA: nucleoside monophosphate kinase [Candidatus Saccharimonadales bacterium]|nr:nucleoside monophosphate kinase [Candidatus Saccharimonadales bacterium]
MNILFLGPQGSGKGTQAQLLSDKLGFFYFEAGDFLRKIAEKNKAVKKYLDEGKLVPEDEFASYVQAFFDEKRAWDEIIFDGFPRTLPQYEFFNKWLKEKDAKFDFVFVLNINVKTSVKRLSARRMDTKTGIIYNLITNPPGTEINQTNLVQREDDKPEIIKERLLLYQKETTSLIDKLKKETKVFEIDGEKPIEEVQREICKIVGIIK